MRPRTPESHVPTRIRRRHAASAVVLVTAFLLGLGAAPSPDAITLLIENVKVEASFYGREFLTQEISARLLASLAQVPRQEFVPEDVQAMAWENRAVVVGQGRTLPAPHVSVLMVELLAAGPEARVLEIGTGTGYHAALLAPLVRQVFTVEPVSALATEARARLARLGYGNVEVRQGEGLDGWAEKGPFDAILVNLAVGEIPPALVAQLKNEGTMVLPLATGGSTPYLTVVHKNKKGKIKPRPRPLLAVTVEALPAPR